MSSVPSKVKAIFVWSALALAALLLVLLAAVAFKWHSSSKSGARVELLSGPALTPAQGARLGDAVTASALFKCPWGRRVGELAATPGEGVQLCSEPSASIKSLAWGYCVEEVSVKLQPYRTGELGEGLLHASFSNGSSPHDSFDLKIPKFAAEPLKLPQDASLSIAGKLKELREIWPWLLGGALLLIAVAVGVALWLRRSRKVEPPPPPWTLALAAISALRARLSREPQASELCLSELTDVVRRYLELRFEIRAQRQTTAEFLASLERGGGPLSEFHRAFLKEFLAAADMVKFAKLAADRAMLEDALLKAEKLVLESVPSPDAKGGKAS